MKYHSDGSLPAHGQVFVFGSNTAGIHGAGAAVAALRYGARWGIGYGRMGQSYAIPTKNRKLQTLPFEQVRRHVHAFLDYARSRPGEEFFITRIGCGYAGYKDKKIAPLFGAASPNCSVAVEWRQYIEDVRV